MNKTINLLVILVLASSFVLAQSQGIHEPGTGIENPEVKEAGQGTGQGLQDGEPVMVSTQEQNQGEEMQIQNRIQTEEALGEQEKQRLQTGLENALTKVKNENAQQRLEQNLDKWMNQYQERLQKMENLEIESVDEETGEAVVTAQEPVKYFGFIQGKATKRFTMDKNGNISEKAPWYSIFYTEE